MFIAIVGTPSAGKRTVLRYLIERHGFTEVGLEQPADPMEGAKLVSLPQSLCRSETDQRQLEAPLNGLSLSSSPASVSAPALSKHSARAKS